jgi:hypothetical protein
VDNYVFSYVRGTPKEADAKDLPTDVYVEMKRKVDNEAPRTRHFFQSPTAVIRELVKIEVEREIYNRAYHHDCLAGKKFVEIYQDGRVAPCEILETLIPPSEAIMGKIQDFDYDINKLLASERAQKVINYIKNSKCHCTFECPKNMDVMYNKQFYPSIASGLVKRLVRQNAAADHA